MASGSRHPLPRIESSLEVSDRPAEATLVPGPLDWTGRAFGGLRLDVKRRAPCYTSDWTDAFRREDLGRVVATVLFLFFAAVAPAITFGNLYEQEMAATFGVVETIMATATSGVFYSIFSGQPIAILGATGPIFAYTVVCHELANMYEVEFLPFYFWILMWCSLFTVLMVMFDLCALMRQVTPFSGDIFSGFISIIFIVEAVKPVIRGFLDEERTTEAALLDLVLMLLTYKLAAELTSFRRTPWFTLQLRGAVANFGVFLAIAVASPFGAIWEHIDTEFLQITGSFCPTKLLQDGSARSWLVSPLGSDGNFPLWTIFFAALPAVGFALVGYLGQNLTTVLVNRPFRKLQKQPAYHLDLFVRGAVCTPVCALLGLPLAVASTAPSLTHLMALTTFTVEKVPEGEGEGDRKVPVKVCEQRVTNLLIHLLLAASLFLSSVLKRVPKAVLFGAFLYMGVASLSGNALWERLLLFCIWDTKSYPQFEYVQKVRPCRMHFYTVLQVICLAILYSLKTVKQTAVFFPFFMAFVTIVRKGFKFLFTEEELQWLDGEAGHIEELEDDEVSLQRQISDWVHNVEPDLDIPFGRGVTPLGKHAPSFVRGVSSGSSLSRGVTPGSTCLSRGVTPGGPEPRLSMHRGVTPADGGTILEEGGR